MKRSLIAAFLLISLVACIENDIPYPKIYGEFLEFEVQGQTGSSIIDATARTVEVEINETIDKKKVVISNFSLTDETVANIAIGDTINLSDTVRAILTTYQQYVWTIHATQNIIRRAMVHGQIGAAEFNEESHIATIYVNQDQDLSNIMISELKLGPSNATTIPEPSSVLDFTVPRFFDVMVHGETTRWQVIIVKTNESIRTKPAEPWAKFAILNGEYDISSPFQPTFEYRPNGASEWTQIQSSSVNIDGATFTDTVRNLIPETAYQYRAVLGDLASNIVAFTTEAAPSLPNLSFDDWHKEGKVWNPWLSGGEQIWTTGNAGVTTFGESNTTPVEVPLALSGKAAKLETVSISLVGLAAGNLFVGKFELNIFNPNSSVKFGKPYIGRPTALKGFYKYIPQVINYPTSSEHYGEMDKCHIYIFLEDWEGATTRPENPKQIAYGEFKSNEAVDEFTPFTIKLNYSKKNIKPTHIIIVGTSSYLGDFYTGGIGSTLYLDEFELAFD